MGVVHHDHHETARRGGQRVVNAANRLFHGATLVEGGDHDGHVDRHGVGRPRRRVADGHRVEVREERAPAIAPAGHARDQVARPGAGGRRFEQGEGGVLTPVLCVDKTPDELSDMATLVAESRATGVDWDIVFVAALADQGGSELAERHLQRMVESLKMGSIDQFLAFDRAGEVVGFQ